MLLEGMGGEWYSAEAMARLGRRALAQIGGERETESELARGQGGEGSSGISPAAVGRRSSSLESGNGTHSTVPMISGVAGRTDSSSRVVEGEIDSTLASVPGPVPTGVGVEGEAGMGSPLAAGHTGMNDLDSSTMMQGFADIDTLFGEFLDISLPTNFWDPIFVEDDVNNG